MIIGIVWELSLSSEALASLVCTQYGAGNIRFWLDFLEHR